MGKLTTAIKAGQTAVELTQNAKSLADTASSFKSADKGVLGRAAGRQAFNEGADIGKTAGKSWLKTFEWIFALLVAGGSAITAALFLLAAPFLFIAWIVVFGLFAGLFLGRDSGEDEEYKGSNTRAMKIAVWVDFVNSLLWFASAVYGCIKTMLGNKVDRMTDKAGQKMFSKKQAPSKDNYAESV
ncbi:unnamed protein product [Parascedosporium putredinis]|uniref:Uncharacterized protein n=1 Tax=Parascedosporium putredinis TaxID=1442378 RepID=A0A9P1MAK7_9PEZI|nr:unnamed protein product [Parascedosporium putredinis]CAI7994128.1 unnamed protein product [Parascedosporium putredinis]